MAAVETVRQRRPPPPRQLPAAVRAGLEQPVFFGIVRPGERVEQAVCVKSSRRLSFRRRSRLMTYSFMRRPVAPFRGLLEHPVT